MPDPDEIKKKLLELRRRIEETQKSIERVQKTIPGNSRRKARKSGSASSNGKK